MAEDFDLEDAYGLKTPSDNLAFYEKFSKVYDQGFAESLGYVSPREIAKQFRQSYDGEGPVLDIGAGTGLLGDHLRDLVIDGIDISPAMLEKARLKSCYRNLMVGDLTAELSMSGNVYDGLISCGTFTHGHVGPKCLTELLRVAKPGALFCLGVVPEVYDSAGFGSAFAALVSQRRITPLDFVEFNIYENANHAHAEDKGLIAIFHKT